MGKIIKKKENGRSVYYRLQDGKEHEIGLQSVMEWVKLGYKIENENNS